MFRDTEGKGEGNTKVNQSDSKKLRRDYRGEERDRDVEDDFDSHPDVGEGKRLKQGPGSDIHAVIGSIHASTINVNIHTSQ